MRLACWHAVSLHSRLCALMLSRLGLGGGSSSAESALTQSLQDAPHAALANEVQAEPARGLSRISSMHAAEDSETAGALPIRRFERSSSGYFAGNSLRLGGNSLQFGKHAKSNGLASIPHQTSHLVASLA